jgi:hypothetical protein
MVLVGPNGQRLSASHPGAAHFTVGTRWVSARLPLHGQPLGAWRLELTAHQATRAAAAVMVHSSLKLNLSVVDHHTGLSVVSQLTASKGAQVRLAPAKICLTLPTEPIYHLVTPALLRQIRKLYPFSKRKAMDLSPTGLALIHAQTRATAITIPTEQRFGSMALRVGQPVSKRISGLVARGQHQVELTVQGSVNGQPFQRWGLVTVWSGKGWR